MTGLGRFRLGCALCASLFATAASASVTANYGCRFYIDGKVFVEFRIEELSHTRWAEQGTFIRGKAKPVLTDVEAEGSPVDHGAMRFRLPEKEVEIVVANTLEYANARYSGPQRKDVPGECEQADTRNALNRWFLERERETKKRGR